MFNLKSLTNLRFRSLVVAQVYAALKKPTISVTKPEFAALPPHVVETICL